MIQDAMKTSGAVKVYWNEDGEFQIWIRKDFHEFVSNAAVAPVAQPDHEDYWSLVVPEYDADEASVLMGADAPPCDPPGQDHG